VLGICDFRHKTPRQSHLSLTWPKGPGFSGQNKSSEYIIGPFTYEHLNIGRLMTFIVDGAPLLAVMDASQGSKVTDDIAE